MKSILEFAKAKRDHKKITMVTSYDSWTAKIVEASPIDCILIGDSCMMTMHGRRDTVAATIDIMALHTAAVRNGAPTKFLIADMPFLAHKYSVSETMESVRKLMAAGANAIKIEGLDGSNDMLTHIIQAGVPVMGHLGLTPQSVNALGGFKVQATENEAKQKLKADALALQSLGVFALVLECVPSGLAKEVSEQLEIPTIGIGAGRDCDGQVLVLQDLIGADPNFKPRFVRRYMNAYQEIGDALSRFQSEVETAQFPNADESFP